MTFHVRLVSLPDRTNDLVQALAPTPNGQNHRAMHREPGRPQSPGQGDSVATVRLHTLPHGRQWEHHADYHWRDRAMCGQLAA